MSLLRVYASQGDSRHTHKTRQRLSAAEIQNRTVRQQEYSNNNKYQGSIFWGIKCY